MTPSTSINTYEEIQLTDCKVSSNNQLASMFRANLVKCIFIDGIDELFEDIKDTDVYTFLIDNYGMDEWEACVFVFTTISRYV